MCTHQCVYQEEEIKASTGSLNQNGSSLNTFETNKYSNTMINNLVLTFIFVELVKMYSCMCVSSEGD